MKNSCNKALTNQEYHIRDFDIIWLENYLDQLLINKQNNNRKPNNDEIESNVENNKSESNNKQALLDLKNNLLDTIQNVISFNIIIIVFHYIFHFLYHR